MKLSDSSCEILKNFSIFNEAIHVRPGNILSTINKDKNFFAIATVEETFITEFAISSLKEFLGVMSIFSFPDLDFQEKMVTISENQSKIRYRFTDPSMIIGAPAKKIEIPDVKCEFDLSSSDLSSLSKSLDVLVLPEFMISGDGKDVNLSAVNSRDMESNQFHIHVGSTEDEFRFFYPREFVKLINRNYKVLMSKTGLLEFRSENLSYFVMGNAK